MHTKIMIIGSPGSGKSTFARKLRDKTGLPLFYLDMIKHKPDRTTISSEEFETFMEVYRKIYGNLLQAERKIEKEGKMKNE